MPVLSAHPTPGPSDQRGIALAIALLGIVVIGALISGAFVAGRVEMGSGRNTVYTTQASEAAEAGLADAVANWDEGWNTMVAGTTVTSASTSLGSGTQYSYSVTRMGGSVYFLRSTGERSNAGGQVLSSRTLGRIARLVIPDIEIEAAVTSKGNVTVGGNAEIRGEDNIPLNWGGCAPGDDKGGVRSSGTVSVGGSAEVSGDPPEVENDTTVVDALFQEPFNELAAVASMTIGPGTYNGMTPTTAGAPARCDKANGDNWGEPNRSPAAHVAECVGYFPIILATGNIKVQTGRGQGILLVDGDLDVRGNFIWDGIVIVLGEVKTNGTGNKITGGVLANNATIGDLTSFIGNPDVLYSSCAIAAALQTSARAFPLAQRSWSSLY